MRSCSSRRHIGALRPRGTSTWATKDRHECTIESSVRDATTGVQHGLAEPAQKLWLARLAPPTSRGAGFGTWQAAVALTALPAALAFGGAWTAWGPQVAFGAAAALGVATVLALARVPVR